MQITISGSQGYVYSESICSNRSISVLQHDLDFRIQTRIAHQIGRSLGLTLDDNVDCIDDGSVMSPILYPTGRTGANPWRFSACSQREIVNVLKDSHKICLTDGNRTALTLPAQYTLPGVSILADHQCGLKFGPNFTVCREHYGTNYTDICYGLWCCNTSGVLHSMVPFEGIPCNKNKRCIMGACIDDQTGHTTGPYPDTCLFGDSPIHIHGNSCGFTVKYNKSMCYDTKFKSNCCWSCSNVSYEIPGCPGGDRGQYHICDDIDPWGCYDKQIRDDCCETCSSFRLSPPIPVQGCDYGDKRAGCDAIFLGQCYQNHTRYECCQYCHDNKTGLQGCQYGDRIETCDQELVLECYQQQFRNDCCQYCDENETGHTSCLYGDRIEDCIREDCYNYSQFKRNTQCCKTCRMSPNPNSTPTHNTQLPTDTTTQTEWTTGSTRMVNSSTVSTGSGGNNMGLIVGVSVGAVCLVLVLIVAIICWRRRRNKDLKHLSPITDKMYNDYKLSKRAPVPEPRDIQRPKSGSKQKLIRQDSEVYAYINPNDVASIPSKTGTVINPQNGDKRQSRNEDDPLPPTPGNTPGDYLELKVVDKYGYMEPVEKHKTISTPYSEPYSDNQATLYPHKTGEPPYKNQL